MPASRQRELPTPLRLVAAFLPTVLVLGLLEATTRFLYDKPDPSQDLLPLTMCESHPTRVWQYKALYSQFFQTDDFRMEIRTNSWRLRDREPRNRPGALTILALGDSFTFGWGVQIGERFTEILRQELAAQLPDQEVAVLNAGHWMYTFDQQLLLLEELLLSFQPQVVLQGVYAPHVLTIGEHKWKRAANGRIQGVQYASFENEIIVRGDGSLKRTNRLIENPPLRSRFVAKLLQRYYRWRQLRTTPTDIVSLYDPSDPRAARAWELAQEAIRQAALLASAAGAAHIVFGIPQNVQVHADQHPAWFREYARDRNLDFSIPMDHFAKASRAGDSVWVDLLPVFRERYTAELYFPRDPHWTAAGHSLAAEVLQPVVREVASHAPVSQAGARPVGLWPSDETAARSAGS